jgi:hypothetical protein
MANTKRLKHIITEVALRPTTSEKHKKELQRGYWPGPISADPLSVPMSEFQSKKWTKLGNIRDKEVWVSSLSGDSSSPQFYVYDPKTKYLLLSLKADAEYRPKRPFIYLIQPSFVSKPRITI